MKTVIEMAREAGFVFGLTEPVIMVRYIPQDGFERFAELVRADEREACIKACWELELNDWEGRAACIAAIRARGNT